MAGAPPRTAEQAGTGPSELLSAVSAPVHFSLTGARLTHPVRITFRIRPGVLPSALSAALQADAVWLSFYDTTAQRWQPVASQYDPATDTVSARVQHLSWWTPWTWNWAGTVLRIRQTLSALGSGRARPVGCPGVPHVTLTSAGGQDPPLIGCAVKAGRGTLTVNLTNNRSLTMVMSGVPADAIAGRASYTGAAAFLTDRAFREAFARRLGGAILPATETIPYSVPLHGTPEDFSASITNQSKLLDLALIAGEEGFGGITHQYLTCLLNTVLRSQVLSLADLPELLATDCLPVLASTIPALKGTFIALGKKAFFRVVGLVILDIKLALLADDKALDQFRGIHPQVRIERLESPSTSGKVPLGYNKYTNPRFGFTTICPSAFRAQPPPQNGDGQAWTSPDGLVRLSAFGTNNVLNQSPQQDESADSQGLSVVYSHINRNIVTVSGYKDKGRMIVYQQDVVGPGSIDTLYWSYPASQKKQWDAAVTLTAHAFQPGDVVTSH